MADFALGLAKSAVEGTLSRVQSAIDEEDELKEAAKQDLMFITSEFQMMQAFLKVANKERASNEVVKTWVRQLRDLAFDVEDCVEFVIHLDSRSACWTWMWRLVPPSMAPSWTRDLDEAVAELKQLKDRVEEVSQRNTRYNLIRDSGSTTTTAAAAAAAEQLGAPVVHSHSTLDILKDLWGANVKRCSFCDLQELITMEGSDLRVISMWRSAGADVATAHILNAAYSEEKVCLEFKARARVKLMRPFNPDEFLKSLLNQLYVSTHHEKLGISLHTKEGHVIQQELKELLSKQRYLIILEDLSSTLVWEFIKLYLPADKNNGSRVVISTEQLGIALSCTEKPYLVSELRHFPDGRYLHVFFKDYICIAELLSQLGQRRMISLQEVGGNTSSLVKDLYEKLGPRLGHMDKELFNGANLRSYRWVEVPRPFNLTDFYRTLFNLKRKDTLFLERSQNNFGHVIASRGYLIVINGLQSREDWDLVRAAVMPEGSKSCIVVISDDTDVVTYCKDETPRVMKEEDRPLTKMQGGYCYVYNFGKGCSAYRPDHPHIFLNRRIEDAYGVPFVEAQNDVRANIHTRHVWDCGVNSVWGIIGVGKSALVRCSFHAEIIYSLGMMTPNSAERMRLNNIYSPDKDQHPKFEKLGWVDVPDPFDLEEFSRRLFLDFHSYDLDDMETAAVGIMQGLDPVQGCYGILHQAKCLVVVDGLRSTHDWDMIREALLCESTTESSVVVITIEESVTRHCVDKKEDRMINVRALEDDAAFDLFKKVRRLVFSQSYLTSFMHIRSVYVVRT